MRIPDFTPPGMLQPAILPVFPLHRHGREDARDLRGSHGAEGHLGRHRLTRGGGPPGP